MTVLLLMTFGALFQVLTLDAVVQRLESKESVRELNHTFIIHSQVRFFFFLEAPMGQTLGILRGKCSPCLRRPHSGVGEIMTRLEND